MTAFIILLAVFATAALSAIFGMAGGLILMGVLAALLPVSSAMVLHGLLQGVSNGWRAILLRNYLLWRVLGFYLVGSAIAAIGLTAIAFSLPTPLLFIALGCVPLIVWIPTRILQLDPRRPVHGIGCGFVVTGLNVIAGVSGPLLDSFMQNVPGDRRSIVATKAASQVAAHSVKIAYYILPALSVGIGVDLWLIGLALPLSILGTTLGARVLDRMSDANFRKWTKWIVTGIGGVYVLRGLLLLYGGSG